MGLNFHKGPERKAHTAFTVISVTQLACYSSGGDHTQQPWSHFLAGPEGVFLIPQRWAQGKQTGQGCKQARKPTSLQCNRVL